MVRKCLYGLIFILLSFTLSAAESPPLVRVLIVLDGSFSMKKSWAGGSKWDIARSAILSISDSLKAAGNVELGIRIFGHQFNESEKNCKDSKLEIPIGPINKNQLEQKLDLIRPKGITPIMYSLEKAAADFSTQVPAKNVIILITDGEEACGGDLCRIAADLQRQNVSLRPFIIGMALPAEAQTAFECAGEFVNTLKDDEFRQALAKAAADAIARTTIQVNILDEEGRPTETNMPMTFTDALMNIPRYHFWHTLNGYGLPDTFEISPTMRYDLTLHCIPPIKKSNIRLERFQHNIIDMRAPQGTFRIHWNSKECIAPQADILLFREHESTILLHSEMGKPEQVVTGTYRAEVLSLPPTSIPPFQVDNARETLIEIPCPGKLNLLKAADFTGSILKFTDEGRLIHVCALQTGTKPENLFLMPGRYRLVYRLRSSRSIHSSVEKEFVIPAGGSVSLSL